MGAQFDFLQNIAQSGDEACFADMLRQRPN